MPKGNPNGNTPDNFFGKMSEGGRNPSFSGDELLLEEVKIDSEEKPLLISPTANGAFSCQHLISELKKLQEKHNNQFEKLKKSNEEINDCILSLTQKLNTEQFTHSSAIIKKHSKEDEMKSELKKLGLPANRRRSRARSQSVDLSNMKNIDNALFTEPREAESAVSQALNSGSMLYGTNIMKIDGNDINGKNDSFKPKGRKNSILMPRRSTRRMSTLEKDIQRARNSIGGYMITEMDSQEKNSDRSKDYKSETKIHPADVAEGDDDENKEAKPIKAVTMRPENETGHRPKVFDEYGGKDEGCRLYDYIPLIHPENSEKQKWNILMFVFILYHCFTVPFRVGFEVTVTSTPVRMFDNFVDILFMVDIALNFMTGYYKPVPSQMITILVLRRKKIFWNYVTTWFFIDALAIFPFHLIFDANANAGKIGALIRITKLFRLVRLVGMMRYLKALQENYLKPHIVRVFLYPFILFLLTHFVACMFFFVSKLGDQEQNWVIYKGLIGENITFTEQYINSLYWATSTMTTVGYGDIVAQNDSEKLYSIMSMVIGTSVFAFLVGSVSRLVASLDETSSMYRSKMNFIREYMSYQELPPDLQHRIKSFYSNCWKKMKSFPFNENVILEDLSPSLKREVVLYLNREMVEKVPLFQGQPVGFICRIILAMKQEISAPLDWIIMEGEVGRCMYFLRRGMVEVTSLMTGEVFAKLSDGCYFGEIALVSSGVRTASIRALYHCDMLTLDKSDLDAVLYDYPDALRQLIKHTVHGKYKLSEHDKAQLTERFKEFNKYFGTIERMFSEGGDEDEDSSPKHQSIKFYADHNEIQESESSSAIAKLKKIVKGKKMKSLTTLTKAKAGVLGAHMMQDNKAARIALIQREKNRSITEMEAKELEESRKK